MMKQLYSGHLTVVCFTVNLVEENCYLVYDADGHAALIDCGAYSTSEREEIAAYLSQHHLHLIGQWYTHGHFDHVWGSSFVHATYGQGVTLAAAETDNYLQAEQLASMFLHRLVNVPLAPIDRSLSEGDVLTHGTASFSVIATPGHTAGGICFYCESEGILFSGDSLFLGSIGRCDLPGGNELQLRTALRNKVLTLPASVRVFPGHGPTTTIGHEQRYNAYI